MKPQITRLTFVAFLLLSVGVSLRAQTWIPRGPAPNSEGQVENIPPRDEVSGAINAVALHPENARIAYVGAVNGGIWRTNNATAPSPNWQRLTDDRQSLSIGALEFDPSDGTRRTLVAGIGRFSSFGRSGGDLTGLLRTTDAGGTWKALDGGGALIDLNVSGVAPLGEVIVISVNSGPDTGIHRSVDAGATWTHVSGAPASGLPSGRSFDLVTDPRAPKTLYTNAGGRGIFKSDDTGATWGKVSNAAMDALIVSANNIELAVGRNNNVYAAIVTGGTLATVFRSGNGGTTWVSMGAPTPTVHPGGQGGIHLSIAADPRNHNIVYLGGDRQDFPFPNDVGALDFSGRLFRGDARRPVGSNWFHLTHSSALPPAGGGTTNSSAPHADSRDMDVAANGVLIEVDDGGIYRRTFPQTNQGDWFSMNGDIQTAEFHAVAWDAVSNIVIGGTQDTGTPEQVLPTDRLHRSVATADGGVVAVEDISSAIRSTRYSSNQFLGGFRRRVYSNANVLISQVFPARTVIGGGSPFSTQFYTPLKLNTVSPRRLVLGGGNSVYESLDRADTIREIGPGIRANAFGRHTIAYGAHGNADVLYVGASSDVFVRTAAHPSPLVSSTYSGSFVEGVALDPSNGRIAYAIDSSSVFRTNNAGGTWVNITGNLPTFNSGRFRSVEVVAGGNVAVGTNRGVYTAGPPFTNWSPLGMGLPNAPVFKLEYDRQDQILLAGTLGRGAWTLSSCDQHRPSKLHAFARVSAPTAPESRPESLDAFNPTEGEVIVRRAGTGEYSVHFVGLARGENANRQTRVHASSANGKVTVQAASVEGDDLVVKLNCKDSADSAIDSEFLVAVILGPAADDTDDANVAETPSEEQGQKDTSLKILPGVLVSGDKKTAFVMNANSGIDAIELATGKITWATKDAARPLALVGNRLVGQSEPSESADELTIVTLDARNGAKIAAGAESMPAAAPVSIGESLKGSFDVGIVGRGEQAIVAWQFSKRRLKGVLPPPDDGALLDRPDVQTQRGTFLLNLGSGATSPSNLDIDVKTLLAPPKSVSPSKDDVQIDAEGVLFMSIDQSHVLASRVTGGDEDWEQYTLTVFDKESKNRLGEFKSHLSTVPFIVRDSLVVFTTGAYARRVGGELVEQPLKLRAVDLTNGQEAWSHEIRDTTYRGPLPP